MAKIERGGVRLVVENYEAFERQMAAASASMKGFGQEAQATARMVSASAGEYSGSRVVVEEWSETIDTSAEATAAAAQSYTKMGLALTALGAAGATFLVGVGLQASRIEELSVLLEVTRKNAIFLAEAEGDLEKAALLSAEAVEEQVQGVRALNLSGEVANRAVAELIRYNLDWTRATELARLAQDAATFAMQDSSEAVKGLIAGITTLQPRLLRTYGLMINLNVAYRKYAEANNVAVADMTVMQRQQAAFQEVLALAPSIAGAYEAAMGTAAKQVRSLRTDVVNLAEAFGEEYTPILDTAIVATRDMLRWLRELDDPIQAAIVGTIGAGSALSALAGAALLVVPRLSAMVTGFRALATAMGLVSTASQLALGGLAALIPVAIGIAYAIKQAEDARQEEAAALLVSSDSYGEYESALLRSELANYKLTESMYDTIQAHKEATDAAQAQLRAEELIAEVQETRRVLAISKITGGLGKLNNYIAANIQAVTEERLALYADADAMTSLAIQAGYATDAALDFGTAISELAKQELFARDISRAFTKEVEDWDYNARLAADSTEELSDRQKYLAAMSYEADDALKQLVGELQEYYKWMTVSAEMADEFTSTTEEAFLKATDKIEDAALKRNRALEDLDTKYLNKSIDAWRDYQDALAESEGQLEQFHAGTLDALLDMDLDYLRDRNDAWDTYQQDLADAERELQRDIEDANRERAQALADLDRDFAQDRQDALRDLNQDLEDMARDHSQRLLDIERDRQESLLDLEQDYQDRLYNIQNLAQQKLRDLQDKYDEAASDTRLRYLREAIAQIEGSGYGEAFEQVLRDLFLGLREFGPGEIPTRWQEMYRQMLEELAKLDEDRKWDEEDLSDDIDREQERRLEDLEEWLAEERAAIEAAHEERLAAEQERYADEQAARQEDYERKLEDLRVAQGREREEIQREHERRLADIRLQSEREREELAQTYARRIEDLTIEYDRERELIGQKLEEQNQTARDKYDEALRDIAIAKEREREEINKQYARTKEDIQDDYEDTVRIAAEEFGKLPAAFQPVYDALTVQAQAEMRAVRDAIMAEINGLFGDLQARSPSRVMMKLADSIMTGLEAGGLNPDAASDLIGDAFSAQAFQANISAALPEQVAAMPMGMSGGSSSTTNNNLSVTAQYQHQSEASLRDDLSLYNSMLRAWGR